MTCPHPERESTLIGDFKVNNALNSTTFQAHGRYGGGWRLANIHWFQIFGEFQNLASLSFLDIAILPRKISKFFVCLFLLVCALFHYDIFQNNIFFVAPPTLDPLAQHTCPKYFYTEGVLARVLIVILVVVSGQYLLLR